MVFNLINGFNLSFFFFTRILCFHWDVITKSKRRRCPYLQPGLRRYLRRMSSYVVPHERSNHRTAQRLRLWYCDSNQDGSSLLTLRCVVMETLYFVWDFFALLCSLQPFKDCRQSLCNSFMIMPLNKTTQFQQYLPAPQISRTLKIPEFNCKSERMTKTVCCLNFSIIITIVDFASFMHIMHS